MSDGNIISYEDQYIDYMNMKSIEHLWFGTNNSYINSDLFDELYKLEWFKDGIVDNRDLIDDNVAKNIRGIIDKYKYIEDENSIKRKEIINEIIIALNSSYDKDKNYEFYKEEAAKRFDSNIYLKATNEVIEKNKQMLNESISCDYILLSMLCDFSDTEFNKALDEVGFVNFHILSLNAILKEFPLIITNPNFIPRVNTILKKRKLKENKKMVKKIKKLVDEFNKGV